MALENIILGERSQTQNPTYCTILLYEMSRRGKSIDLTESRSEAESRFVIARAGGWGWGSLYLVGILVLQDEKSSGE